MNKEITSEAPTVQYIDRKDFMKQVGIGFGAIMLMQCLQGCTESEIPDPDPGSGNGGKLDITLDLNASSNASLNRKGGFVVISSSKVIAAQTSSGTFIAVSSACTHQGTTVAFQSNDTFRCPNHGSVFTTSGAVQTGPATQPLKKYNVSLDQTANTLRIFE